MISQPYYNTNKLYAVLNIFSKTVAASYALTTLTWVSVLTGEMFTHAAGVFTCQSSGRYRIKLKMKVDMSLAQTAFELNFKKNATRLAAHRTNGSTLLEDSFAHRLYWDSSANAIVGSLPTTPSVPAFGSTSSFCEYIYNAEIDLLDGDTLNLDSLGTRNSSGSTWSLGVYDGELEIEKLT